MVAFGEKSYKSIQILKSFSDENIEKKTLRLIKNNKTYKKSRLQMVWNAKAW